MGFDTFFWLLLLVVFVCGTVINPGGERSVYYGAMDVPLSPLGEKEAVAAAEYLSQFQLSRIYSSPLSRAVFGAERIAELQPISGVPMQQLEGFTELDRGDWCGKTKDESM
jgi:broad specificity phosphatase PhoE